ncbi:hypothetical protein [Streptomyces acidiscabies]|uniref:hypothetical protein n=1 Tax=Streptomyces acidiscabies TaxID=42234 RepID=UPI000952BA6E|nr:hypothetical protein [Streptomyces acidiscabies]
MTSGLREDLGGHRPPRHLTVTALLLPVAVALGTACSGAPAAGPSPAPDTVPPHWLPPIYAAVYDTAQVGGQITAAQGKLIARCMRKAGFTYPDLDPAEIGAPDRPRPFGLESLEQPLVTRESPITEKPGPVDQGYMRALYDERGCQAQADVRLFGEKKNLKSWSQTRVGLYKAEVEAKNLLWREPGFMALNARWAACMKRAGFVFRDPLQVLDGLPPKATFRAEPTARADVACKDRTGYLRSAYTGLAMAQRHALTRSPDLLPTWKLLLRRQCDAARQILAQPAAESGGPSPCPAA